MNESIDKLFYNKDVISILDLIQPDTIGAEIGVWLGNTSEKFLQCQPKTLYLIDPYSAEIYYQTLTSIDNRVTHPNSWSNLRQIVTTVDLVEASKYLDEMYARVQNKFKDNSAVVLIRKTSTEWFEQLSTKLDWIYIDGNHSYECVSQDLINGLEAVRAGGLILGDDYSPSSWPEVCQAVDEVVWKYKLNIEYYGSCQYCIRK